MPSNGQTRDNQAINVVSQRAGSMKEPITTRVAALCAGGVIVATAALLASCGSDSARSAAEEELTADEVVVVNQADDADEAEPGDAGDLGASDSESTDADPTDSGDDAADTTDTDAADTDSSDAAEPSSDPKNLAEAIVQSVNRGVRICIENNSSKIIYGAFTVYNRADQEFNMAKGDDLCGEGATTFDSDVKAEVDSRSTRQYIMEGHNPWLGKPFVTLYTPYSGKWPGYLKIGNLCVSNSGWDETETRTWDDGVLKLAVTRKNDSNNFKEFVVRLSDTTNPGSSDVGVGNECNAGDYP